MGIFRIVRFPNRDRRSPETVARNRPVACAFKPFAETSVFDMLGHPVDFLIVFNHLVAKIGDLDKPRRHRLVNQRRIGAPAERIRVGVLFFLDQQSVGSQPLHDRFVGFKNLFPFIIGNFGGKFSGFVHRTNHREVFIIGPAGVKVVLSETGRNMDHAGTVFGRHELAAQDLKRTLFF